MKNKQFGLLPETLHNIGKYNGYEPAKYYVGVTELISCVLSLMWANEQSIKPISYDPATNPMMTLLVIIL